MLVLGRKLGQAVHFPEISVTIRVVRTRRGRVQLCIDAPAALRVVRKELMAGVEDDSCAADRSLASTSAPLAVD
jgi:carbon storage regulator CsrA